jgi:hypothetical protein
MYFRIKLRRRSPVSAPIVMDSLTMNIPESMLLAKKDYFLPVFGLIISNLGHMQFIIKMMMRYLVLRPL